MICKWLMNGSAIENGCITNYVYQVLNTIINQSTNQLCVYIKLMRHC